MLGSVRKRDDDRLDYDVDYSKWLTDDDSITGANAVADSADIVVEGVEIHGVVVKVWLSGGIVGASYSINVTATTTLGRIKEVTFNLRITEC
jgi:hypothetical protein